MGGVNMNEDDIDDLTGEPAEDPHSDDALLAQVKRHKRESDSHLSEWREEARDCYGFVAGDQWTEEERSQLTEMLRAPVVFNRIGAMIESIAGTEVNNRQAVQYIPRQVGASAVNEVLTGAADYFRDQCDAEDEESDAFLDLVICGVGCTETRLDYIENPEGMTVIDRRDPMSMSWDPAAKKKNLSDRRWTQREEWMDVTEIEQTWPDKKDQIAASPGGWVADADGQEQPHDATFDFLYEKNNTGRDPKTGKLRVIHETWYELETYYFMADPFTGQGAEFSADEFAKLSARMKKLGLPVQAVKKQRKKWMQVFVCGDVVLEFSDCACNDDPYKFITGRRDRNKNTWYGVVKAMIDPQKWANKFFSQTLHIINTNAKGGLVVEKGATDNLRKFKTDWAKSDGVTVVEDGAISGGKIMPKPVPNVPVQISQMLQFSISSMRDVSGLNLEILGMADRQQAGVLEAQRKQAALTVLATLFDSLRRYRKEQGRLMAKFIRDYLSDGRLIRIMGTEGAERYVPLIRDPSTMEYDVVVDEAANTVNQKDKTFAVLMQLLPTLAKMGAPFTSDLLEYMPLPAAMVEKWKQTIKQNEEQAKQNPPPPPPQLISAQASMKRADAAMLSAQAGAQADMQEQQREAQLGPFEQQIRWQELQLQDRDQQLRAQELQVREQEALAEQLRAQADAEEARWKAMGFANPAAAGIGSAPQA